MKQLLVRLCAVAALLTLTSSAHADTVFFQLSGIGGNGLLTTNELHGPSGTGSGGILSQITFDTVSKNLSINVGWGSGNGFNNLTGNATAMHIHGPAGINATNAVLIGLDSLAGFNANGVNGGFNGTVVGLSALNETRLLSGQLYINVHTGANGAGEIRGNLFAIPEPATGVLGLLAALCLAPMRRR